MAKKQEDEKLAKALDDLLKNNWSEKHNDVYDNEGLHIDADDLIAVFLYANGYEKAAEKYNELRKYFRYA